MLSWENDGLFTFTEKSNMRDSNTFMYIVGGIILLHFGVGFIWLWVKMNKKKWQILIPFSLKQAPLARIAV